MSEPYCVFCGMPSNDDHHIVAKTLLKALPNLSDDDRTIIFNSVLPMCRHHHDMADELARIYVHIIRCVLEGRPYHLDTTVSHRKINLEKQGKKNNILADIVTKLDVIIKQTRKTN